MGDGIFQFRVTQSPEEIKEKSFIVEFLSVQVQDKIRISWKIIKVESEDCPRKWFSLQPSLSIRISVQTWQMSTNTYWSQRGRADHLLQLQSILSEEGFKNFTTRFPSFVVQAIFRVEKSVKISNKTRILESIEKNSKTILQRSI